MNEVLMKALAVASSECLLDFGVLRHIKSHYISIVHEQVNTTDHNVPACMISRSWLRLPASLEIFLPVRHDMLLLPCIQQQL